ncbi:MAG: protein kinase, partial [Actinomycetota bacterium]|nr:protein kinase [Actinomycetota bacterium]
MQRDLVDKRYSVLGTLGGGGMGQVYLARDELLDREVALKVLRSQHAENQQFVERFRREAKNAAALSHPNIVSVYDAGEGPDGVPYMAMEYVGGGTLGDLIEREAPLDALLAAGIALQVACALQEAHKRGVIHRDIKPLNIFLVEEALSFEGTSGTTVLGAALGGLAPGSIKVGDFGIARAAAETAMTETSLILGTVRYLSPEQATGDEVGPASDLYSLGVVLYEMLTGEVPFDAENPIAIAMKHVSEAPVPPREKNPGVPEGLQTVTLKLLSKDPEDRYTDAGELVEDLERVGRGQPLAHPVEDETATLEQTSRLRREAGGAGRGGIFAHPKRSLGLAGAFVVLTAALVLATATGGFADLYESFAPQSASQPVSG